MAKDLWLPSLTDALAPEWDLWHYGTCLATRASRPRRDGTRSAISRGSVTTTRDSGTGSAPVEAYAYLPFAERIEVTRRFVESLLDFAAVHAAEIRRLTDAADAVDLSTDLPVRAEIACGPDREILMGEVVVERQPYTGEPMLRRLPVQRPESMPDCTAFRGTEVSRVPAVWIVPAGLEPVVERLAAHGVPMLTVVEPLTIEAEAFAITSSTRPSVSSSSTRSARWKADGSRVRETLPGGTVVVRTAQPLGRLAFYLLDPRSDDGLVAWNLLDEALEGAAGIRSCARRVRRRRRASGVESFRHGGGRRADR